MLTLSKRVNVYCSVSNSLLGYYTTFSESALYTFIKSSCVFDGNGKQLTYAVLEK